MELHSIHGSEEANEFTVHIIGNPNPEYSQKCTTSIRRQSNGMVCCRDPNFKSEEDYDDYDDYGNVDYLDFGQVMMYNMNPPMTMTDQLNTK